MLAVQSYRLRPFAIIPGGDGAIRGKNVPEHRRETIPLALNSKGRPKEQSVMI
jgi:hypothetical protein